jgi:hypothetical protein
VAPKAAAPAVTPAAAPAAPTAARVGKTTMLGVQAPKAPVKSADDSWDVAPTRIEEKPNAPAPVAPTPSMVGVSPPAPAVVTTQVTAPAAAPGLNASDVRLIVRTIVEEALLPLQRALVEAQQRITELERRPPPAAPTVVVAAAPAAVVAPHYASAMAAPAVAVAPARSLAPQFSTVPPAPLLDVKAIERDVQLDFKNPFDGARRRRRMAVFLVIALLAIFGGLFGLLADSYSPHHEAPSAPP